MPSDRPRTIVIAGGGTGGHVYPGLALAAELLAQDPSLTIRWIGSRGRIEERAVPRAGIAIEYLDVPFLKGRRGGALLKAVAGLPAAGVQAVAAVRRHRPAAVIGLGGFVSGPVGVAAKVMGVPLFLLEQNARPGITNRELARVATAVYASFDASLGFFAKEKALALGNPVRSDVIGAAERRTASPDGAVRVLVFGGSQGARSINENVPAILADVIRGGARLAIRHAAGAGNGDAVAGRYAGLGVEAAVTDYIDDMAGAYADTDFVVCRAGATTIAELTIIGLPALYVPFPFAADDHQTSNARAVVERGGGVMVSDAELSSDRPVRLLGELLRHPEVLARMGHAARSMGRPDSARDIASDILRRIESP